MSVNLDAKDGTVGETISNGAWAVIVGIARMQWGDAVPAWDGTHDGAEWTPEHLTKMANSLEGISAYIPILRELAKGGGVVIS